MQGFFHLKVIPRDQHTISIKEISDNALKIISNLRLEGHQAYLVGGAVRDLLLGVTPKDFDVATSATPEEIRKVFRFARIIGRRFRIAHIRFGREIIEVTTFRGHQKTNEKGKDLSAELLRHSDRGLLIRDNIFGTIEEDAIRRDLTVNALYYDPESSSVIDYTDGIKDLNESKIEVIGEPCTRFREDPVRILRVIRFSAKLNFRISSDTKKAIREISPFLSDVPAARLFDEFIKLFFSGVAKTTLKNIILHSLLNYLLPDLQPLIENQSKWKKLIYSACANTDLRISQHKSVTPSFLLATLLWPRIITEANTKMDEGENYFSAVQLSASKILTETNTVLAIPRRFSIAMREIWELQYHLENSKRKTVSSIINKRRFRAAFDLLVLRERAGDTSSGLERHWIKLQNNYKKKSKCSCSKKAREAENNIEPTFNFRGKI